jgi:branched-chain amino acid transport system ATP-binding protein
VDRPDRLLQAGGGVRRGVREIGAPSENGNDAAGLACEVRGVTKSFGGLAAVDDVTLGVERGSLTCLIGPNGAGKSTLLGCISGLARVDAGSIVVFGRDVTRWTAHRRTRSGLGAVFQTTRPLENLDVLSNAMVGCHPWTRAGFVEAMVRAPWERREERRIEEEALRALELVGLADRADARAGSLPLGQLRLLAVARALAQRPSVLLLDEPAAGLRGAEKARLAETLLALRERELTQILVEHDMGFVGALAERVIVLDRGRVIADGTAAEVRANDRVVAAYLGSATL